MKAAEPIAAISFIFSKLTRKMTPFFEKGSGYDAFRLRSPLENRSRFHFVTIFAWREGSFAPKCRVENTFFNRTAPESRMYGRPVPAFPSLAPSVGW
jgi:hypothetical protein